MSNHDSDNSDFNFILNKLDNLSDGIHEIDKKSDITLTKLEAHFKDDSTNLHNITRSLELMGEQLTTYNKELNIHIAGVNELRRSNDLLEQTINIHKQELSERLSEVEAPLKWFKGTKKVATWIAALAAAAGSILALIQYLQK